MFLKAFEFTMCFTAASSKLDLCMLFCVLVSAGKAIVVKPKDSNIFFSVLQ